MTDEERAVELLGGVSDQSPLIPLVVQAFRAEREACARVAAYFSVKPDASIYPGMPFADMNETARTAAHTTAQQIAAAIRDRSEP